jgi:predicted transposase YbfD/YdcC
LLHPKKVGTIAVKGNDEEKQTNEIGMFVSLLNRVDNITGKTITTDALLTQRGIARYLVKDRKAHYLFTVKGNQPTLLADIQLAFESRGQPDFAEQVTMAHGRIECRTIWTTTVLNDYLDFPFVEQVFVIARKRINKKTGKDSTEIVYGMTSHSPESASPAQILGMNRHHWCIENKCHYIIDWNFDEDRCRIRTGYGPENTTRLRRFVVGVIKSISQHSVASTIRKLSRNSRLVFDYLRMTENSQRVLLKNCCDQR